MASTDQPNETSPQSSIGEFGANEWLVDDMYQRYLADPDSVDAAWHDFFADYRQGESGNGAAAPVRTEAPRPVTPQVTPEVDAASAAQARAEASAAAQNDRPPAEPVTTRVAAEAPKPAEPTQTKAAPPAPERTARQPEASEPAASKTKTDKPGTKSEADKGDADGGDTVVKLRGAAARVVANMESSLSVPTATSVRAVPAKLLADNRVVINNHLRRARGGKVSFTHVIGYAVVRALADYPEMNRHFAEVDGKPAVVEPEHVGLGLAIDLVGKEGARSLVVASIKRAETLDFAGFWNSYEEIIRRARAGKLTTEDFAGTTISLTNPGTIGTNHSVPRLMAGQGTIVGVGAMEYPAEFSGMSEEQLTDRAISKIMTLTSTYDHRIIQGAQSGEFLRRIHQLLLGDNGFWDEVFQALTIPYEPVRWVRDIPAGHEDDITKSARVHELIHAYRVRGHLGGGTPVVSGQACLPISRATVRPALPGQTPARTCPTGDLVYV